METAPRKRKAEPDERHDGRNTKPRVSCFFFRTTVQSQSEDDVLASMTHSRPAAAVSLMMLIWEQGKKNRDGLRKGAESRAIQPGDTGIWATCAMKKEAKSVADLRDLFQEVSYLQ